MTFAAFSWKLFLDRHRERIMDEWQRRLKHDVSERYIRRPAQELTLTTGTACDAFCQVLAHNDYGPINQFIGEITRIRLEAGFPLADVQKAFELFRQLVVPLLVAESPPELLCRNIEAVNSVLADTIHRFSNHFQSMHEQHLKDYARRLEQDVAARTSELRESEQRYRRLVEEIRDGYLILRGVQIEFVNAAFCHLHGSDPEDTLRQDFLTFVADADRDRVRQIITRNTPADTETDAFEYQRCTREGQTLPTEINFRPSWFKGHEYHLCIVRDITRRVATEQENRKLERMAYIGHLTASLSHEIRNPLSAIKMNLQILSKNPDFRGNDKRRLEISEREIIRLEGILQQLLDFARPVTLNRTETRVNEVIRACVDLLDVRMAKQGVHLSLDLDPGLPLIFADPSKLEQVLINLMLNGLDAIDISSTGTVPHLHLSTAAVTQDEVPCIRIRVQDSGSGIPDTALPRIFDPFFTTRTVGTGLGLANVKLIVKAHKGWITVTSPPEGGTALTVFLPRRRNAESSPAQTSNGPDKCRGYPPSPPPI